MKILLTPLLILFSFSLSSARAEQPIASISTGHALQISGDDIEKIPEFLLNFSGYKQIDITGTSITSITSLQGISGPVRTLTVRNNKLLGLFPTFENFSALDTLVVSENPLITNVSQQSLTQFHGLTGLHLTENNLTGFQAPSNLSTLRELTLSNNPLEDEKLDLRALHSLEVLRISCTTLKNVPADLPFLVNLKEIEIKSDLIPVWQIRELKKHVGNRVFVNENSTVDCRSYP